MTKKIKTAEKSFKYKLCLHKGYFEKGMSLNIYLKYLIAFFGFASMNVKLTLIIAFFYGIWCYISGRLWFKYNFIEEEQEVYNDFNRFVREMRCSVKRKV